jgi:hypothetical protein
MTITCPYIADKHYQDALELQLELEELESDYPDLEDRINYLLEEEE